MEAFIAIFLSFGLFFIVMIAVIVKMKRVVVANADTPYSPEKTAVPRPEQHLSDNSNSQCTEGVPTLRNVKHPTTHVQTVEEADDDQLIDVIPDFADEDEARKAIITAEIINRKY